LPKTASLARPWEKGHFTGLAKSYHAREQQQEPEASLLPANEESERLILGAVLRDGGKWYSLAAASLNERSWSLPSHRLIWIAMTELVDTGRPLDLVTLTEQLTITERDITLARVGGNGYLDDLNCPLKNYYRGVNIAWHIGHVREVALRRTAYRRLVELGEKVCDLAVPMSDVIAAISGVGEELRHR
jgi:replicative DNA helicase